MTTKMTINQLWTWIPSGRLVGLLAIGGLIATLFAALLPSQIGLALLFTLGWYVLLIALAIVDATRVGNQQIQVSREKLGKLSIGRDNPIKIFVKAPSSQKNPGQKNYQKFSYQIRDFAPTSLPGNPNTIAGQIAANGQQEHVYTVHPYQRGEYDWQGIQVRQLSPWGLTWQQWRVDAAQPVVVYPDLIGLKALSIKLTLQSSGTIRQTRRLGAGTEFTELREYAVGDDPRLIDWKATARRNRPLIRVLEPEQEQTIIILLDRGRLMTANIQGLQRFDLGLNATLSLALAAIQRGDKVGVGVFDRTLHTWLPPQRGQQHMSQIIDRLSRIQPDFLEPDYVGAINTVISRQNRRALVVIITDIVDTIASAELLTALSRLAPRYLPFCVTLRDPQVDHLAHNLAANIPNAYEQAVAIDLLQQRKLAFAKLQQRGVMVLDAPANQMSDQLVEQYLQIKQKGRL
jgi:uncharacterized protein (DUF58 family)